MSDTRPDVKDAVAARLTREPTQEGAQTTLKTLAVADSLARIRRQALPSNLRPSRTDTEGFKAWNERVSEHVVAVCQAYANDAQTCYSKPVKVEATELTDCVTTVQVDMTELESDQADQVEDKIAEFLMRIPDRPYAVQYYKRKALIQDRR